MSNSGPEDWFKNEFRRAYEEQFKETGRFNLAVFGKTGVGKSTLVKIWCLPASANDLSSILNAARCVIDSNRKSRRW